MRWPSTLCLIDLGALLQAPTHTVDGTLARLGLSGQGAVTATVALLAKTGTVGAVSVLRAVVQACADVTSIARPPGVAVALALDALAVSTAPLTLTWAAARAVIATPPVLASTDTIEAVTVVGAVVGARLLRAIVALVTLITHTLQLRADRGTLTVTRAG